MGGLTKKHFIKIAKIVKNSCDIKAIDKLAEYFETENPNFDKEKFIKACK